MDLLDRYLSAVGLLLPSKQRADITAELRDVLMNRREEKEAQLGRPLSGREQGDLLRAYGHPVLVAARYGPHQTLIGPDFYPIYAMAVKVILAIMAIGVTISGVVQLCVTGDPGPAIGQLMGKLWTGSIAVVGALTIIFWALERNHVKLNLFDRWDPADLPDLSKAARLKPPSVAEAIAGIIVGGVFLSWWTGLLGFEVPIIRTREGLVLNWVLAPVWAQLYWPIIGLTAARIVLHAVRIGQGAPFTRFSLAGEFALHLAGLAFLGFLLRNGPWLALGPTGDHPAKLMAALPSINLGLQIAIIVLIVLSVIALALDAWRFWRLGREVR